MQDIYDWIEEHRDEEVAELQELLRQPSISAQNIGLDECAELLKRQMLDNGIDQCPPHSGSWRAGPGVRHRKSRRIPTPVRCCATATMTSSRQSPWRNGSSRPLRPTSATA